MNSCGLSTRENKKGAGIVPAPSCVLPFEALYTSIRCAAGNDPRRVHAVGNGDENPRQLRLGPDAICISSAFEMRRDDLRNPLRFSR